MIDCLKYVTHPETAADSVQRVLKLGRRAVAIQGDIIKVADSYSSADGAPLLWQDVRQRLTTKLGSPRANSRTKRYRSVSCRLIRPTVGDLVADRRQDYDGFDGFFHVRSSFA